MPYKSVLFNGLHNGTEVGVGDGQSLKSLLYRRRDECPDTRRPRHAKTVKKRSALTDSFPGRFWANERTAQEGRGGARTVFGVREMDSRRTTGEEGRDTERQNEHDYSDHDCDCDQYIYRRLGWRSSRN